MRGPLNSGGGHRPGRTKNFAGSSRLVHIGLPSELK
jgi:hypothetical protein